MAGSKHDSASPSRSVGFVAGVLVNVAMLLAVHVWPGWEAVPFLTNATTQVLGLVTLSILAGIVANLVYLFAAAPWVRPLGDLVTTGIGLAAVVRVWQVFPFDFGGGSFDWAAIFRVLLVLGIVGSAIGVVVALVTLVRQVGTHAGHVPGHP